MEAPRHSEMSRLEARAPRALLPRQRTTPAVCKELAAAPAHVEVHPAIDGSQPLSPLLTPLNTAVQNSMVTLCSARKFSLSLATASCVLM